MTFVASDPLSELVWSPHKGLSLKCAGCSLVDKKPSLLWDVGPSDMTLLPLESIRSGGNNDDIPVDDGNVAMLSMAFHAEIEVADKAELAMASGGSAGDLFGSADEHHTGIVGKMEELDTAEEGSALWFNQKEEEYGRENEDKVLCRPKKIKKISTDETSENTTGQENKNEATLLQLQAIESKPGIVVTESCSGNFEEGVIDHNGGIKNVVSGSQILGQEVALASNAHVARQQEVLDNPRPNYPGKIHKEMTFAVEEESKDKVTMGGFARDRPLAKLELTAEKDLKHLVVKEGCGPCEETRPEDESVPLAVSPTNCQILLYQRKGKEKVMSDGDVAKGTSKEEDGSHESVESCNNAGLISKGRKRQSFEQQFISGSKKVKKQVERSAASTSFVREDSSFMNWISNIVKGLVKYNQDEAPLALTLAYPSQGHESHDPKRITCGKSHDSGGGGMGFQTMFQSLYSPSAKLPKTKTSNDDCPLGGSKELLLTDKTCVANITPISCHRENGEPFKKFLGAGEKFSESAFGNDEGPSTHPLTVCAEVAATQETYRTHSVENENSSNLACHMAKDGVSTSASSLMEDKISHAENNDFVPLSEVKAIDNVSHGSYPLESLWITRFSPKNTSPMKNSNQCSRNMHAALECSDDCMKLIPPAQNFPDLSIDQKRSWNKECSAEDPANVLCKELQNNAPSTEAFFSFKNFGEHKFQKTTSKLNPIIASPKVKSSEVMASMFARRLDALKHINASDVKDDAAPLPTICMFCGRTGHDLCNCSRITNTDLDDLLSVARSYEGAEQHPCLCIRCFQLDHWAVTCPVASSSRQQQSEHGASFFNHQISGKLCLCTGTERHSSVWETKDSHGQVDGENINCNGKKPRMEIDHRVNTISDEKLISDGRVSSFKNVQMHLVSSSEEKKIEADQITPLCNLIGKQTSNVPKGAFDVIRRLRLSRTDILKLVNSHIPLSCLNGFFLRLRLRTWEERLGGTGYYVACITGVQRKKSPRTSKDDIFLHVGGIKCFVQSRYVSNHDFLEEELVAWWSANSSGGDILSEEALKLKFEERKKLGF